MTLFSGLMWKFLMVLSPPLDSPSSFLASNSCVPAESSCLLLLLGCLLPSWTIENDLSCLNCARVSIVICLARVFQGFFLHRFAPTQVSLKHDLTASSHPILLIYNLLEIKTKYWEYYWIIHEKEQKRGLWKSTNHDFSIKSVGWRHFVDNDISCTLFFKMGDFSWTFSKGDFSWTLLVTSRGQF